MAERSRLRAKMDVQECVETLQYLVFIMKLQL